MIDVKLNNCRNAEFKDISLIVEIHLAAFQNYFLSQLGYEFLSVMYKAFLRSPKCIFVVFELTENELGGFVVGTVSGGADRWLALRFFPQFLLAIVPAVVRHPINVVRRLIKRFFDADEMPDVPSNAALLRSIGVLPSIRGGGAAIALLKAFEVLALAKGAEHVYLTTDEVENERAQRFYVRAGYGLCARFKQDGRRRMWLMSKKIKEAVHE